MTFPKARLVVSACLFLGWLGFLLYLVLTRSDVVLSRPQFMLAQAYVVVHVREGHDGVIAKVLWCADPADRAIEGQPIHLPESLAAPSEVLAPLQKNAAGKFEIAPIPRGASFPGVAVTNDERRVYPWTPATQAEVNAIIDAKK